MASFKKGDRVTFISNLNSRGTFYYVDAVVYSCGRKQMVLTNEATGEEMGRHFHPESGRTFDQFGNERGATFPRMTDDEAQAMAREMAAYFLTRERARLERCAANEEQGPGMDHYRRHMREMIDALTEPTAIRR